MYLLTKLLPHTALMAVITASALLTGCLESASESASNVNSFPQGDGTGSGFSESTTGSVTNESNLDRNQVRVSVQVPEGIADGEGGRRNLLTTTNADLSVTRVDENLQTVDDLNPRIKTEDNAFIITFRDRSQVPSDIDLIVTATVGSNTYQAPLAAGSRHVRLNPFTDYLVHRVIDDELSQTDINNLKTCSENLCPQALVWSPLVDQVQNFEIDIPSNSSAGQARSFLDERADFADFVAQATQALTLDQDRIGSLEGVATSTTSFNTVYFGTSLNLDRTENTPFWATRTISRGESVSNNGVGFAYPSLTLTSFAVELLDLNITSLASDVPYIRNSAGFSDLDGITNSHSTSPGPAFIRDGQSLIASRPVFQSITRQGDRTTGWAPDPHYLAGYLLGETNDPEALLSSYFHAGKTLSLTATGDEQFDRDKTLEEQATSALEINLPQWGDSDGTSLNPHPDYNLIGFELIPADGGGSPAMVRATLGAWNSIFGDDERITANEDTSVSDGVVWELTNNAPVGTNTGTAPYDEAGFDINAIDIQFSSDGDPAFKGHVFYNHDTVEIQEAGLGKPNGSISPDHRWMAFSARSGSGTDTGDFIRIAHHHDGEDSITFGDAYRLVGYDITLNNDEEQLEQLNGSCLVAGGSNTLLVERGLRVSHTPSNTGSYTSPEAFENPDLELDSIEPQAGRFTIADSDTDPNTVIKGFIADEGNTLVMLKKTEQSLGIMLGFREDEPAGCPSS
ncbi:hypothetical protein DES49_1036 [Halospina denitrificans]|uniref:Uncharacterized protein n=1 Tax=Halospina denitrificans TaxID=332522 RepID=A0A4R7JXM7_9GAMM|nr:hypothetical protein [Halospina denitrificans]TDT43222.1 hypothetical protein DES49_1036 [Halospina denitrificans]